MGTRDLQSFEIWFESNRSSDSIRKWLADLKIFESNQSCLLRQRPLLSCPVGSMRNVNPAPWFCSFRLWHYINDLLTYLLTYVKIRWDFFSYRGWGWGSRQPLMTTSPGPLLNLQIQTRLRHWVWNDHGTTWLRFWSIPRNRAMLQCTTACFLSLAVI